MEKEKVTIQINEKELIEAEDAVFNELDQNVDLKDLSIEHFLEEKSDDIGVKKEYSIR